jgi:hypothetical protein
MVAAKRTVKEYEEKIQVAEDQLAKDLARV